MVKPRAVAVAALVATGVASADVEPLSATVVERELVLSKGIAEVELDAAAPVAFGPASNRPRTHVYFDTIVAGRVSFGPVEAFARLDVPLYRPSKVGYTRGALTLGARVPLGTGATTVQLRLFGIYPAGYRDISTWLEIDLGYMLKHRFGSRWALLAGLGSFFEWIYFPSGFSPSEAAYSVHTYSQVALASRWGRSLSVVIGGGVSAPLMSGISGDRDLTFDWLVVPSAMIEVSWAISCADVFLRAEAYPLGRMMVPEGSPSRWTASDGQERTGTPGGPTGIFFVGIKRRFRAW